jgi:hypothetical protein
MGELVEDEARRATRSTISPVTCSASAATGTSRPMRRPDRNGQVSHWILEVHLVDSERGIGGFFEQLLDLSPSAAES